MPPPIPRVSRMARGMVFGSLASSLYMVMASKPMKEKHTTVAPVRIAAALMPSKPSAKPRRLAMPVSWSR